MKIFLTGANGNLGIELLKSLANTGYDTLATGKGHFRHNKLILNNLMEYAEVELSDAHSIENSILPYKPTHILHLGAITQVDECELNKEFCYSINTDSTAEIIKHAKVIGAKLIYLSTDFVFDGSAGPYEEDHQVCPVNYYGTTKMASEKLIMESGLDFCIIRTVLLYGKVAESGRSNFIHWVKQHLENKNPIKVVNDQVRTPTYIPDLVKGILETMRTGAKGIYHISGDETLTPFEMAIEVAEHLSLDKTLITAVNASSFTQPARRPLVTGFNIAKARSDLGFNPTPFKTALSEIFND